MKIPTVNRLLWLFALLCVTALAISTVHSLTEEKNEERLSEESFEEGLDGFDYDNEEGEYEAHAKQQELGGPIPPQPSYLPPPPPPPPPSAPSSFGPPPPPSAPSSFGPPPPPPPPPLPQLAQYHEQPIYLPPQAQPLPPPKHQETVYLQQPQQVYQPPVMNYTQPQAHQLPVMNYTQPQAYQPPVYQPSPPQTQIVVNYTQPKQQTYRPVPVHVANYSKPIPIQQTIYFAPKQSNYSAPMQAAAQQVYTPNSLAQKYSLAELAPFITPFGYRGNHLGQIYYRNELVRPDCPKHLYANGPAYRDIESAFAQALQQLGHVRSNVHYMNASVPSFAARHQIFSLLSQQSARMDEEGLLLEFVGQYLAERMCMSKWDRQRYLPSLTRVISASQFPNTHSCSQYYSNRWSSQWKNCHLSKYRTYDGFCNNPHHPYWGKTNVCHIRLLSPDYADGVALPRESSNIRHPLPNARIVANFLHNDIPLEGPYNLMKMQWGQLINHDISNTALSSYDGLVDCCKQPQARGCWPILIPPGDRFYGSHNVSCLNFIRSGVCPTCQLGPRQQTNKNTAFLDASHVYGHSVEQANQLRAFVRGQLKTSGGRNGEQLLPLSSSNDQCTGVCYQAGDSRVNQHPALTVMHLLLLRNHNRHAHQLALRHPNWSDEIVYQEARRINIAEYQMITFNEYLPIVFGPILSAYYQLIPLRGAAFTQYNPKVDPSTWNEYTTAACRFGHSQISSTFGLYAKILGHGQVDQRMPTFRLKDWFMRPSFLADGLSSQIVYGLLSRPALSVDPWITTDVRNHLYQSHTEKAGGDLAATNIWRGRDHGLPGYVNYLEYCFNHKVRGWKELQLFIPNFALNQLRKLYKVVENIDLFSGGLAERHFPGADIGPTFACINGIQYNHLKFGDRFYFEHANQAGSFTPIQLEEIKRATLARLLCRTANLQSAPQNAFLQSSMYNPLVNCSQVGDIDYNKF